MSSKRGTASPQASSPVRAGASRPPARGGRLWLFRCGAILLGLLPFVALEAGLRLLDLGRPGNQTDPLAGFGSQLPLFERAGDVYRTVRSRGLFFGAQEFAAKKPAGTFRIFCFGGSTVHGHPYQNATAFPNWLAIELNGRDPARRYEAINCGGVSYASYRLAPIVREVLKYQPDLIVLAMGHNEFLEDRSYQPLKIRSAVRLWLEDRAFSLRIVTCARRIIKPRARGGSEPALAPEVETRLDEQFTGYASYHWDDEWHRQVVNQFEVTLRAMITECRAAHVPVMIVALGSNLRDCPPFKSEHRLGITPAEENQWQLTFDAATRAEEDDLNAALALYEKAAAIDGEFALLTYRLARCYDRLGQAGRAREYYVRAKEQDVCPLRMIKPINQLNHALAEKTKSPLVDAEKLLGSFSPDSIPGSDLYLDHVHPTIGGHQKIAGAIADKMGEAQLFHGALTWPETARRAAYRRHLQELEPAYFSNGRRRVEWLEKWARRQRLYEETLPKDARGFLHRGFRALDLDDEAAAWRAFRSALAMDSALAIPLIRHALDLWNEGRPEPAARLLERMGEVVADGKLKAEIARAAQAMAN